MDFLNNKIKFVLKIRIYFFVRNQGIRKLEFNLIKSLEIVEKVVIWNISIVESIFIEGRDFYFILKVEYWLLE